ncbi:conjugal transfer protein TraG N-terminal domain-containing protein, partial [Sutterella massiliensis]
MSGTRQFNLHQVFLGFLCYLCFFGPSVTVHIEDAYTGNVRSVDNVPIGAGVAGTLISSVGYGVTQLFEQGYSDVDRMTERAFGESLQLLNNVRSLSYDASIVDAASTALGPDSDLRKTLDNYMRECTMLKIVVGQGTPEEIYTGGFDALGFQSTIYGTQVFLPGQNGTNMDCAAAWQQLKPRFLQAVDSPQAAAALNRLAGARDAQGQIQTSYDKIT